MRLKPLKPILCLVLAVYALTARAQPGIKNPLICHDSNGFLKSYYDGSYHMHFAQGHLLDCSTADSTIMYTEKDRLLTLAYPVNLYRKKAYGVSVQLLPHAILFKKDTSTVEITSIKAVSRQALLGYGVVLADTAYPYTIWLQAHSALIRINVEDWGKTWRWDIILEAAPRRLALSYCVGMQNSLYMVYLKDDSLRYGFTLSSAPAKGQPVRMLESMYMDTLRYQYSAYYKKEEPIMGHIKLDKYYRYLYDKRGRLIPEKSVGEIKKCDD